MMYICMRVRPVHTFGGGSKAGDYTGTVFEWLPPALAARQEDLQLSSPPVSWYLVDNSDLQASSYGLGYRASKDLEDLVPSKAAVWGERVVGQHHGDGWIQVGDFFLPEELEGKRVLVAQDDQEPITPFRQKNVYRYMLQHVTKEPEIDLLFTGLLRLLSSVHQAQQTYLPRSMRSVGFYQEALVLLWHVLTLNSNFTKRVVERHDTNEFLLSLMYLLQQARASVHLIGLLHTASFVLLVLSSERAFAVRLNDPYVAKKVPLEIPAFHGNHADVFALSLYKVISESLPKTQNDALVEMLLTALCNVSPYVKCFCLESCLKLVSLVERLSRPSYLFRTPFTHHGLLFLVEMLNNIVQYQYEGNTMMVYAILRQAEAFSKMEKLSLADSKKAGEEGAEVRRGFEVTEEWLQSVKKKLPLHTLQCLIEYLNPQLEVMCVEQDVTDQAEVLRFLKSTTLVGILPVPHPIVIRTYQASGYTSMWFTSYMWGVIFTRSQRMPLYDWKKIRLVTINQ
ncbi:Protein HID1 (HID1 domain-containing protein) (Protein hid-1 homolog) [Durusdinium trenchii]|uniref:Protein HID1 (HID1 domain-containing protein) (Protein hid-1 homolog) n=1 Tax=Durusdinium trenchii TaxID=1381693 RepID=A0ABP0RX32_9DINO